MKKLLLATTLIGVTCAHAKLYPLATMKNVVDSSKQTSVQAEVGFYGVSQESTPNKAKVVGLAGYLKGHHRFYPMLNLKFNVGANLESGSSDSLNDNNEFAANSKLKLREAVLVVDPIEYIQFEAGALRQSSHDAPLLYTSSAVVGARETLSYGNNDYSVRFQAVQSTPKMNNLNDRIDSVDQGTPSFFSESISLYARKGGFKGKLLAMHYAYDKLSNGVAKYSDFYGNTVTVDGENSATFAYDFIGWNYTAEVAYALNHNYSIGLFANLLKNDKAPEGRNAGELIGLMGQAFYGTTQHNIQVEIFSNESDSSVAYYNSKYYGHNNKKGQSYSYNFSDLGNDLSARLKYTNNKVIDKTLTDTNIQDTENIIYFELRKIYDIF